MWTLFPEKVAMWLGIEVTRRLALSCGRSEALVPSQGCPGPDLEGELSLFASTGCSFK